MWEWIQTDGPYQQDTARSYIMGQWEWRIPIGTVAVAQALTAIKGLLTHRKCKT
jgi:hypothetical protein